MNNTTTDITISRATDGTFTVDTVDGVTSDRRYAHIAEVATDLVPFGSPDLLDAVYVLLYRYLGEFNCELVTLDCMVDIVDIHAQRDGILIDGVSLNNFGDVLAII